MRILYLIDSLAGGGAESVLANLINYLAQQKPGVTCEVATLYPTAEKYLSGKNFVTHRLSLDSKYDIKGLGRLATLLSKNDYDIVHTHLFPANYYASIVSWRFTNLSWLYTEHSVWNRRRKFPVSRILDGIIYNRFDRIIAVSELVANSLRKWLPHIQSRVVTIPNAVFVPTSQHKPDDSQNPLNQVILFVGRLEFVKGVDVLLHAFANLSLDSTLMLAGEGSKRRDYEQLAVALGISDRVRFLGFRSDTQTLMSEASCVVVPSRWEGLPMVVLEAMATGTPVIATPVGGIPEVIKDGITGWLVPPEDPQSLTNALFDALTDTAKACNIQAAALAQITERYSIQVYAEQIVALYSEILNK